MDDEFGQDADWTPASGTSTDAPTRSDEFGPDEAWQKAKKADGVYNPLNPRESRGVFNPLGAAAAMGGSALGSILGGYRGIYDAVVDKTPDQAADDVRATQDFFKPKVNDATAATLSSKYNPLNLLPNAAKAGGEGVYLATSTMRPNGSFVEGTGSPAAAALTEAGINGATALAGLGGARLAAGGAGAGSAGVTEAEALATAQKALQGSNVNVADLSPALKQKIVDDLQTGPARPEVIRAQADADGITRLTEGQATMDPTRWAFEKNLAKLATKDKPVPGSVEYAQHFQQQGRDLLGYLDNNLGAGTALSASDAGNSALTRLAQIGKQKEQAVTDAYNAVRDSSGRTANLDPEDFYMKAQGALEHDGSQKFLPPKIAELYDDYTNGRVPLNVDSMMTFDKILSRESRTNQNGNETHAVNLVRGALNDTNIASDAGQQTAAAYAQARSLARQHFELSDPKSQNYIPGYGAMQKAMGNAYHDEFIAALQNGTANVDPAKWFSQNVYKAPPAGAKKLVGLLNDAGASDEVENLGQGVISSVKGDVVKGNAGVDGSPNLSADGLNKLLKNRRATLQEVLPQDKMDGLDRLSRTATRVISGPPGAPVNYSNTASALNNFGQIAANLGKSGVSAAAHAIAGPAGGAAVEGAMTLKDLVNKVGAGSRAKAEAQAGTNPSFAGDIPAKAGEKLLRRSGVAAGRGVPLASLIPAPEQAQ